MSYTDPEKRRECSRRYRAANLQKAREYAREWYRRDYAANPEKVLERQRKWRAENREKNREYDRKYYAANPGKVARKIPQMECGKQERANELRRKSGPGERVTIPYSIVLSTPAMARAARPTTACHRHTAAPSGPVAAAGMHGRNDARLELTRMPHAWRIPAAGQCASSPTANSTSWMMIGALLPGSPRGKSAIWT